MTDKLNENDISLAIAEHYLGSQQEKPRHSWHSLAEVIMYSPKGIVVGNWGSVEWEHSKSSIVFKGLNLEPFVLGK